MCGKTLRWQWRTRCYKCCSAFTLNSPKHLSHISSFLYLWFFCQSSVVVQLLLMSLCNYWSIKSTWNGRRQTNSAMVGWGAVNTESMRLAEILLKFQSCALLSKDVSYGPISIWDRLEAFGTRLPSYVHGILNTHLYKYIFTSPVCVKQGETERKGNRGKEFMLPQFPLDLCLQSELLQFFSDESPRASDIQI